MEDSEEKQASLIPALGLLGLGVGVVALAVGIFAMIKVGDAAKSADEKIEKAAALSLDLKKACDRIDSLAAQIDEIRGAGSGKVDALARQTQGAINEIVSQLNAVKNEIAEDRRAIETVAKRSQQRAAALAESAREKTAQDSDAGNAPGGKTPASQKTYKIQPGDTFAKLAKKFNVSVDAIMGANPGANPSRLRIGQEITIP